MTAIKERHGDTMDALGHYKRIKTNMEKSEGDGIIFALCEIRQAVEEGFGKLDQTQIEAALMLVGCKETLDAFLAARLKADKVLAGVEKVVRTTEARTDAPVKATAAEIAAVVAAAKESQEPEKVEKSAEPVDKPEKSAVTLDVGDFGMPDDGSGKT